jgi:Na+/H+ antiporter NhaC
MQDKPAPQPPGPDSAQNDLAKRLGHESPDLPVTDEGDPAFPDSPTHPHAKRTFAWLTSRRGQVSVLAAGGLMFALTLVKTNEAELIADTAAHSAAHIAAELTEDAAKSGGEFKGVISTAGLTAELTRTEVTKALTKAGLRTTPDAAGATHFLEARQTEGDVTLTLRPAGTGPVIERTRPRIGAYTVFPPILAIAMALAGGNLWLSLGSAVTLSAVLRWGFNPLAFIPNGALDFVVLPTLDAFKGWIFVFTMALVGMVNISAKMGGNQGVVDWLARYAKTPRATRGVASLLGTLIFFDDYASTVVVGTSARPLTDKFRVSREKLSYIVDSTSAPVAGLAVISTWIGYEVSLFQDVSDVLGLGKTGYELVFDAIPFRFYCMFTILFVWMNVWVKRDFGPMYRAERRAFLTGRVMRPEGRLLTSATFGAAAAKEGVTPRARNSIIPIICVLTLTLFGLIIDGGGAALISKDPGLLLPWRLPGLLRECLAQAENNVMVLALASIVGSFIAAGMALQQKLLTAQEAWHAWWQGAKSMLPAIGMLIMAWSIAESCRELGTASFLIAALRDALWPALVPFYVFLLAAGVSFATGTSFGTMALLMPVMIPLAHVVGGGAFTVMAMAAVLDGAIFGDHCSPLSDTTLLSSMSSACDHLDHVRTQLPYAFSGMLIAAFLGYIPSALMAGHSVVLSLALSPFITYALFRIFGKDPNAPAQPGEVEKYMAIR